MKNLITRITVSFLIIVAIALLHTWATLPEPTYYKHESKVKENKHKCVQNDVYKFCDYRKKKDE